VIRFAHLLCRRLATALAVVAALALAANGSLGSNHHMSAAAGHDHGEAHSHGASGHSHGAHGHSHADHSHHNADVAALDQDGPSSPDADASCYLNACFAAVVLPCPSMQALPIPFCGTVSAAHDRHGKGVVPDGPRKPPRPLSIA
jgi:hypothetical protein